MPESMTPAMTARSATVDAAANAAQPRDAARMDAAAAANLSELGRLVLRQAWRRTSEDLLVAARPRGIAARPFTIDEAGA